MQYLGTSILLFFFNLHSVCWLLHTVYLVYFAGPPPTMPPNHPSSTAPPRHGTYLLCKTYCLLSRAFKHKVPSQTGKPHIPIRNSIRWRNYSNGCRLKVLLISRCFKYKRCAIKLFLHHLNPLFLRSINSFGSKRQDITI